MAMFHHAYSMRLTLKMGQDLIRISFQGNPFSKSEIGTILGIFDQYVRISARNVPTLTLSKRCIVQK